MTPCPTASRRRATPTRRRARTSGWPPDRSRAHAAIEESPGHRKNLLDPAFERVGFGLARQARDGGSGSEVLLVELLATPARSGVDPVAAAYARLTAERAALKLPALQRSAALEDIAVRQARAALARDDPRAPDIDGQVFGTLAEARAASADLYVARDLAALPPSRGLRRGPATRWWASARCAATRPPTGRGATGWWSSTPGCEPGRVMGFDERGARRGAQIARRCVAYASMPSAGAATVAYSGHFTQVKLCQPRRTASSRQWS